MSAVASAVVHALHSPLLLSTLTNGTSSWSNVTADDGDTILLRDFDRQVFVEVMLMYAAPCAVAFIAGTLALFQSRFHLGLLPSWLLRDWLGSALTGADSDRELLAQGTTALGAHRDADSTFELYLSWLYPSAVFLVVLAPLSIAAFLAAGLLLLDRMFAVSVAYLFFLAVIASWTMMRWKFEGWEVTNKVKLLGAFALATVAAFELYKVYYARPYTFIGLGVFCLMANMLAMIHLAYYMREYQHTEFEEYVDVTTSVVSHLEQQAAEAASKAAATVEAKRAEAEQKMLLTQQARLALASASADEEKSGADILASLAASPSAAPAAGAAGAAAAGEGASAENSDSDSVSLSLGGGGSTAHLASSKHFQQKLSLSGALLRYLVALAALAGYAVVSDQAGRFGYTGYVTAGAIVWLDMVVLVWTRSDPARTTPLQACLLLGLVRFFMIIFGDRYYLVGHACLFIAVGCYFSNGVVERLAPLSRLRRASDDEEEAEKMGYGPIAKMPATAVKPGEARSAPEKAAQSRRELRLQRLRLHHAPRASGGAQVLALLLLLAAFIFDTVLCFFISDARIPCGIYTTLPQSVVGFFGLFVFGVFSFSKLTFHIYVNQHYKSKGWVLFLSLVQYLLILGSGWVYHRYAQEKNVPALCILGPPMVYLLVGLFSQWVKNDFHVILPDSHRNPPRASCWDALLRCGFPGNDYFMVSGIVAEMGLIIALGFALSWYITPSWVGAMVSWVLVVLLTTVTPMVEYFHTFEFSTNMFVMAFTSVVSFFIGLGLIFVIVLDSQYGQAAFILMLAGFLYPIAISFTVGIAKWHDDEWVISDFVVWTNFVTCMLLILMFFSIAMVFTPWWIGGGLMFVEIVALMALTVLPKIKELSPVWYKLICTVSVVLMFGFAISATLEDSSGFTAFTVLCAVCFLALLGVIYYAHRGSPYDTLSIHKHKVLIYSPHVFPIFEFDTMAKGKTNPLTEVNHRVWSVYAIFAVCYVWGVFALFFQSPTTVGLCVSSLSLAATMLFTHELRHRAHARNHLLAEAVDYLHEGSPLYRRVLDQCKWIATKNQLLNDTTLYISTKKNKLATDIGIQTDALVPGSLNFVAQQSIIAHLHFIFDQQNWAATKQRYNDLSARLPRMSCCGLRRSMTLEVEGVRLSRRDAFRLADELFLDGPAFYRRAELYNINMQQELVKAVEAIKYDRMVNIVAMLREQGNMAVTVEHLRSLHPLDPELLQYDSQVDAWTEKHARVLAEHARIRAEKDADQRRRDALTLVAAEHARKMKEERAAAELRQKHAEMEAAKQAAIDEAERVARAQAEELAAFEREQLEQLEAERQRQQREREEEEERKQLALQELERQRRIAEKRREQKELADKQRAEAEAAMAAKEQAELARLRRKAEARAKELEHARLLAEKKARLKMEADMKRKLAELEAKHLAQLELVRKQQEEEAQKARKMEEESAMAAALKAEAEERRLAHEREVEEMRRTMEEQEARMRAEKAKLAADRAAHEAEMTALAAAEEAARARAQAQEQLERRRLEEEEAKKEAERYEQEQRLMDMAAQEEENQAREREREEQRRKHQSDLDAAKTRKQHELEMKREAKKAELAAKNKKDMEKLEQRAKSEQCCTFKITDQQLVFQGYWSCETCGDAMGGTCFCFQCAESCHKGHVLKREGEAPCFCDCGHARGTCSMMKSPAERKALHDRALVQAQQSVATGAPAHAAPDDAEVEHPCKEILRQVRERGPDASWTDPDFGHDDSALFGGAEPMHPEWAGCKWARIKDICKGDPTVFLPPVDANDIRQGSLGNCWLLSAIAVLTQKPDALMGVFVTKEYSREGVYGLRFFKNGKVANVTVDDWLPISNNGAARPGAGLDPLFSKAKDARAIWVMLLEKGYAKLHNSFQNIEGGWIDNALVDLAGGVADRIRWTDEKTKAAIHDGSLFTMLLKYHEQGFLLGAGSPVGTSDSEADASPWGIVQSHAYSILSLAAIDGLQLIQVRNPWGRKEWTGDWSDKSPLWNRRLKSKLNYQDKEDGSFWMSWNDFCQNFDEVYVARFYSEKLWPSRGKVYGEWRGATAGGCVNYESVKNNVQYGLTILDAGPAEVAVSLLLEDVRGVEGKTVGDFPTAILELYDHNGKPINQRERGQQLASSCDNLQEIFIECTVQSNGSKTLTVLPCLFEAGVETSYTLNWYCNKRAKLQQFQQADTQNMVVAAKTR